MVGLGAFRETSDFSDLRTWPHKKLASFIQRAITFGVPCLLNPDLFHAQNQCHIVVRESSLLSFYDPHREQMEPFPGLRSF